MPADLPKLPSRHPAWKTPSDNAPPLLPVPVDAAPARRVLVVEDTEINRRLVRVLMTKKGWVVDEAENGCLALAALAASSYDLVLMDCMMPVMNGYEAARETRTAELAAGWDRIPIIGLTASAIEGDRERCLAAGMDDYLAKPFSAKALAAMVEHWAPQPVS